MRYIVRRRSTDKIIHEEKQISSKTNIVLMRIAETKTSLWERAHSFASQFDGPLLELAPGFSFDSDSATKLYEYNGKVIA